VARSSAPRIAGTFPDLPASLRMAMVPPVKTTATRAIGEVWRAVAGQKIP
jgi:hypothetical protein